MFEPATGSGITNGVVTATVSKNNGAGEDALINAAISVLTSSLGSSPSSIADFVMFCLPGGVMGGIAWAYIDYWMSVYVSTLNKRYEEGLDAQYTYSICSLIKCIIHFS